MSMNNFSKLLSASAAKTSSFQTVEFGVQQANNIAIYIDVTAVSGTTPTLDAKVEASPDGVKWYPMGSAASFAQIVATGQYRLALTGVADNLIRVNCTIGGTTPSFTNSIFATASGE